MFLTRVNLATGLLAALMLLAGAGWPAPPALAQKPAKADPDAAVQKVFDKLIGAIQANDRATFVADAIEEVKKGMTEEVMAALSKQLGSRLKNGYKAAYLCELKQQKLQVHLWKVTFKDDGDDVVVRIALNKDGKLEGFFLQ